MSLEVEQREQVVGVPFIATISIGADRGAYDLDVLLDPGLADSMGEMIPVRQFEFDRKGESRVQFEHELVCLSVGSDKRAFAELRYRDGDRMINEADAAIDCIAPSGTDDTGDTGGTDDSGDTDDTSGSGDSNESDGSDDTGSTPLDADALAFDFAEFGYGISLDEPPSISQGAAVEVQTRRIRAEREGDGYHVLAHYEAGPTERGVLYGFIQDDLSGLERFLLPDDALLIDNAFNGSEFILTDLDAGVYLFDGTTVTEANAPSGAGAVECNGQVCIAGAQPLGVLRSEDGGANWTALPGQDFALTGIAYGDGVFVAYDTFNLQILVSDDGGESWTPGTIDGVNGPSPIEFGDGVFVGPDVATAAILFSPDGMTWSTGTTPIGINEVSYSARAQAWVGISAAGALHAVTSPDGETWEALDGVMGQTIFSTVVGLE